jgi:signal transduction histidine kinase
MFDLHAIRRALSGSWYRSRTPDGRNRVQSRLLSVFILQLLFISIVTIVSVYAASFIAERLLVNRALRGEADYYWTRRMELDSVALPDTLNLTAYLSSDNNKPVPTGLVNLSPGQHRLQKNNQHQIVHVSEQNGETLYLLFEDGAVSNLAFYFGILPLLLVLLTMYALAYVTYLLSKRAVSPISRLANVIENFDFNSRDATELNLTGVEGSESSETQILVEALNHFVERSRASIERERNFTRYASHELRTPLAVIQGSVSSLELLHLDGPSGRAVARIKRTSKHMGDLINTLLLLAREQKNTDTDHATQINELIDQLVRQQRELHSNEALDTRVAHNNSLTVNAPESVLAIVLGNIIANAFSYTHKGTITVTVSGQSVVVEDSGIGMNTDQQRRAFEPFYRASAGQSEHQGLGLAIVSQTCSNYGWEIEVSSKPGKGSSFTIHFDGNKTQRAA